MSFVDHHGTNIKIPFRSQSLTHFPTPNLTPLEFPINKHTSLISLKPSLYQTLNPLSQLPLSHFPLQHIYQEFDEFEIPPEFLIDEPPPEDNYDIMEDLCQICLYSNKEFAFTACQHAYCLDCLRTYLNVKIKTSVLSLDCPKCQMKIADADVRALLSPETYAQYEKFQELALLRMNKNCRWCPRTDCGTPVIRLSSEQKLTCPTCTTHFCFECGLKWHGKLSCEKNKEELIKHGRLNKDDEDWKKRYSRPCPKCGADIEKGGGCNHMCCWSCLHQFCWLCMRTYEEGHYADGGPCAFLCYTVDQRPRHVLNKQTLRKRNSRKNPGRYVAYGVGGVVAIIMLPVAILAAPFYAGYRYRNQHRTGNGTGTGKCKP